VPHSTAEGLLLCAWRAREIDRLLHGRCPEAAMLQLGAQQQMWAVSLSTDRAGGWAAAIALS